MRLGALTILAFLVLLAGCASQRVAESGRVHVVRPGETLFGIAWSYGVDYRELARWNGLDNPDLIFVGQRIRLSPAGGAPVRTASQVSRPAPTAAPRSTSAGAATARPTSVPARVPSAPMPEWRWPTSGRIVSRFGVGTGVAPTGIGITGRAGQAVEAAAAGRVVYAGSGLIGYGQLVIIRHDDMFLSAYGHNARLLVAQEQVVTRGQRIAEMGLGPDRQPRLHFEIRRDGQPIDPLLYLPPR